MSLNNIEAKSKKVWSSFLILLFLTIIFLWHFHVGFADFNTGAGFCADAIHMYSKAIETELVTDWHSSFCMYEAIFLKRLCTSLFDCKINSFHIMGLLFYGAIICFVLNLCYWITICADNLLKGLLATLSFSLAYVVLDKYAGFSLDFSFISALSLYISFLLIYTKSITPLKKAILLLLMLMLLVHIVALRRNSIILIPFLSYALLCHELQTKVKMHVRFLGVFLLSCMIYICSNTLISSFAPVKKSYPVCVMLSSEMRMSSILRGEVDQSGNPFIKDVFRNQYTLIQDSSCGGGKIVLFDYYRLPDAFSRDESALWNSIKSRYMREWLDHPCDMLVVRIIQSVQFLYGAQTPTFIKEFAYYLYPMLRNNNEAWDFREGRSWVSPRVAILRLLIIFAGGIIAFIICKQRRHKLTQNNCRFILGYFCGITGILYLLSFLFVTPSPDARYVAPSVSLALCSIAPFWTQILGYPFMKLRSIITPNK